jgi:TrmH family RNA methyltransferase
MKAVVSRDNADYKAVAKLVSSATQRKRSGLSVLDGPHLLAALLDSGAKPEALYVSRAGIDSPEIAKLAARSAPARVTLLADPLYDSLSTVESPTGVLSVVKTPPAGQAPGDSDFALLLEDIQDPGNVGTLLRSAAAAGVRDVLLSARCAFAWSPKVLRAAMGAHFAVNIAEGVDLAAWLATYRGTGVALAGESGRSLYDLDLRGPVAFVVGNEGAGLSPALRKAARERASIPMSPRMESLNAAAAGTVALFEAARQRRKR